MITYDEIQQELENCCDAEEANKLLDSLDKATRSAFVVLQELRSYVAVNVWWRDLTSKERAQTFQDIAQVISREIV